MRRYSMHVSPAGAFIVSATQTGADQRYPFADEGYRREEVARLRLAQLRQAEQDRTRP
jgi:hypothetical protein